jgi:hypothetical protein
VLGKIFLPLCLNSASILCSLMWGASCDFDTSWLARILCEPLRQVHVMYVQLCHCCLPIDKLCLSDTRQMLTFCRWTLFGFKSQSDYMSTWEKWKHFTLIMLVVQILISAGVVVTLLVVLNFSSVAIFVVFMWEIGSFGSWWSKVCDGKFMVISWTKSVCNVTVLLRGLHVPRGSVSEI